ncbi:16S rRNA (guanine(966)-N(2))-methyltransferase RsmD [Limnobacter humi]|uniref:16S rRNA (Guanine(966)-N(2))-methyltransferase RsmD n=1 Tax=Limnobacter humi TaxID=1778671 RepID=A0ABT1WIU2_9BURK|nr:16S rRNA (guanine(966)-N(2))-methyltransferase RsmD [Limnobacter humi]MCQ8897418.1 16S rRNA (guanine(966)-N(2))-methyltransferase RsmD [Limnobacter humi]
MKAAPGKAAPGSLRIIAGHWRRLQLPVAPVEGLRPTPDRVRETVFNWLGQDCTGWRVLDLYAGTGALGFEAASRGAAEVVQVEAHRVVAQQLNQNRTYLLSKWDAAQGKAPHIQVQVGDAVAYARQGGTKAFDLVALDPPFRTNQWVQIAPHVPGLLKPGGLVYIEWHENLFADEQALAQQLGIAKIDALRHLKAGQVHAHLFALPAL